VKSISIVFKIEMQKLKYLTSMYINLCLCTYNIIYIHVSTILHLDLTVVVNLICYFSESKNLPSEDSNCYEQLMAMEMQSDLVLHNGPFECAVCLCTYDNNGVVLRDCLHVFCRYENTISLLPPVMYIV